MISPSPLNPHFIVCYSLRNTTVAPPTVVADHDLYYRAWSPPATWVVRLYVRQLGVLSWDYSPHTNDPLTPLDDSSDLFTVHWFHGGTSLIQVYAASLTTASTLPGFVVSQTLSGSVKRMILTALVYHVVLTDLSWWCWSSRLCCSILWFWRVFISLNKAPQKASVISSSVTEVSGDGSQTVRHSHSSSFLTFRH